jgi:hypothetical protein
MSHRTMARSVIVASERRLASPAGVPQSVAMSTADTKRSACSCAATSRVRTGRPRRAHTDCSRRCPDRHADAGQAARAARSGRHHPSLHAVSPRYTAPGSGWVSVGRLPRASQRAGPAVRRAPRTGRPSPRRGVRYAATDSVPAYPRSCVVQCYCQDPGQTLN